MLLVVNDTIKAEYTDTYYLKLMGVFIRLAHYQQFMNLDQIFRLKLNIQVVIWKL